MTLRSSNVSLLAYCLVLFACDGDSDGATSGGTTSGVDGSSTSDSDPGISASISVSATMTASGVTSSSSAEDSSGDSSDSTGGGETTRTPGTSSTGGDDTTQGDTTTGGRGGASVYDVQDGTIAEDTMVSIDGVVITGIRSNVGVFVQEIEGGEYSGVYVDTGDLDLGGFSVGDIVDVSGATTEELPVNGLSGLTAIVAESIVAAGGTMVLTPEVVDIDVLSGDMAEPWEGVLVQVSGTFSAEAVTGNDFGQFSEFAIRDDAEQLIVDDFLYNIFDEDNAADFMGFGANATFTGVAGPLNFSFGSHKIAPRSPDDYAGFMAPAG